MAEMLVQLLELELRMMPMLASVPFLVLVLRLVLKLLVLEPIGALLAVPVLLVLESASVVQWV